MYPSHYFSIHSLDERRVTDTGGWVLKRLMEGGGGPEKRQLSLWGLWLLESESQPARPGQEQDGNRRRDGWEDGKWRLLIDSAVERWKKGFHTLLSGRSPINMRRAQCSGGQINYLDQHNPYFKCLKFLGGVCESVLCERERSVSRLLSKSAGTWPLQTERCPWDLSGDTRLCHGGQGEI